MSGSVINSGNLRISPWKILPGDNISPEEAAKYSISADARMSRQTLCFSVSDSLAEKGSFVLKTRSLCPGTVNYYLNGVPFCTKEVLHKEEYEVEFENGTLKGGINELTAEWAVQNASGSAGFDYMRLVPNRFPRGTIYVIR